LGKPLPASEFARVIDRAGAEAATRIEWLVDTPQRLAAYGEVARARNFAWRANFEIDVGLHRGGVPNHDALRRTLAIVERDEAHGADPTAFARAVARLLDDPSPPLRTSCGHASQRFAAWLHDRVPDPIAERVVRRLYAVPRRR
jgi:D-serine deaminase-like pyridoxal phosphate-dependent protein